jgi:catalase (peroxidase I)
MSVSFCVVADMVAMGTVMSMSLCGGKKPPFRPGRIDATQAGVTTGVPAPETDLPTTLGFFARAGFDGPSSIALTACGHTMGSVHHVRRFPCPPLHPPHPPHRPQHMRDGVIAHQLNRMPCRAASPTWSPSRP